VDVMLVLLVIFMLAVPMTTHRLVLESTPCLGFSCPTPAEPINVSLKQTGELYWNGAAVNRAELAVNLAALAHRADPPALLVHPEAGTRYMQVTDLLAVARNADVQRISVETR